MTDPATGFDNLRTEMEDTVRAINAKAKWYADRVASRRAASIAVRLLGYVALTIGVLSPAFYPNFQLPYVAILAGGLLIGLDQVFMLSASWSRYKGAELTLGALASQLEANWRVLEAAADPQSTTQQRDALKALADARTAANQIEIAETSVWGGELEASVKELASRIGAEQKALEQKQQDYAQEQKTGTSGGVELSITAKSATLAKLIAKIGAQVQEVHALPVTLGFKLEQGLHTVEITATLADGSQPPSLARVVKVSAGQIEAVDIKLPY